MTHALTSYLAFCYLNAAAVADNAFIAQSFVLAAGTLPVLCGAEDTLAVKTVTLGLQGSVIYSFGLFYLAVRPASDSLGGSKTYFYGIKGYSLFCVFHLPFTSN